MTTSEVPLLDLRKKIILDLKKANGIRGQVAKVVLCLDYSYSMEHLYRNATVQAIVNRILPLGLSFDDDGEVDFYLFHNSCITMEEPIKLSNYASYINDKVIGKHSMGGTAYAPPILQVVYDAFKAVQPKKDEIKGFFNKLFGSDTSAKPKTLPEAKTLDQPVYVIFITDGDCGDKDAAIHAIKTASNYGIFFQFVGIGSEKFAFLEKLDTLSGRNIDNAGFIRISNIATVTDEALYGELMSEFPSWIPKAQAKSLIR